MSWYYSQYPNSFIKKRVLTLRFIHVYLIVDDGVEDLLHSTGHASLRQGRLKQTTHIHSTTAATATLCPHALGRGHLC